MEEISKPKQAKPPFKSRGSVKKVTSSLEESTESLSEVVESVQASVEVQPEKVPEKKTPNRPAGKKPPQKSEKVIFFDLPLSSLE